MALVAGQKYKRDFTDPKFKPVTEGGKRYYRNVNTDAVFARDGTYVGNWRKGAWGSPGSIVFFEPIPEAETGETTTPGTGTAPAADPNDPCPNGWHLDPDLGVCVLDATDTEEIDKGAQADVRAELASILGQFGLGTEGLTALIEQAVKEDWSETKFIQEMRQHSDYLANPLFSANIARTAEGGRFMSEGEVLAYADEARRVIKQYGFGDISNNYLAEGLSSNLSLAEIEHRLQLTKQIDLYGPVFKGFVAARMGVVLEDDDLFEIFDREIDTQEFDDAFRAAQYQAAPFTLGFGIRNEADQRAAEMLGIDPQEWMRRFQQAGSASPGVARLAAIEGFGVNLPADFGHFLGAAENQHLLNAFLFPGTPEGTAAMAELQQLFAREFARFNVGGGPAQSQTGALTGLLTPSKR